MPREIWNEGRVVGYSSYEIYVKQHISEDPTTPPATEREWLASSLAMGSSMLLKVPDVTQANDGHTYVDVPLPSNSRLAAANTIVAQFFDGSATFSGNWAIRITDYGQLISNTSSSSPSGNVGPDGTVPTQTLANWSETKIKQLKDYLKIYDGVVIQPGNWVASSVTPPAKDFQADLSRPYPRVRLHVRGAISNSPLVLLTGFTIRTVLAGTVGQDTVTESTSPQDGDFLGPAVFPWAAKIVFCVPNSYVTYFASGNYRRLLSSPTAETSTPTEKTIKDAAVIDMQATKPETFYESYSSYYSRFSSDSTNPRYIYNVTGYSTLGDPPADGEAVLTVFQKKAIYPPALYATFVGSTGNHYLHPLDVVAPGSVKIFNNRTEQELIDYQTTFHGTTAINKKSDGTIQILNVNNKLVDVANVEMAYLNTSDDSFESPRITLTGNNRPRVLKLRAGQKSGYALMMSTNISNDVDTDPAQVTISKVPTNTISLTSDNSNDNISWSALLDALRNNRAIDLLGTRLKSAKQSLVRSHGSGSAQGPYIEFGAESKKLRLYITDTMPDPSDVPIGSIGIGWGFSSEQ